LSNRLQELREARGLTLRALAELVGTSNQQLSHLELGKRQLTADWLVRLATALNCHPWEIVGQWFTALIMPAIYRVAAAGASSL
jgi:transcriptional regulator with XRE-family HTH domain